MSLTLNDLFKYEVCDGSGPHGGDDDSCPGGCGGYGMWQANVSLADLVEVLKQEGALTLETGELRMPDDTADTAPLSLVQRFVTGWEPLGDTP